MIPKESVDLSSSPYGAIPFSLLAVFLLGGAIWAAVRGQRGQAQQVPFPLRVAIASILIRTLR